MHLDYFGVCILITSWVNLPSWYTANVEEDGRETCNSLPGLRGVVVLKRRRLSEEEEFSNDNGTER